MITLYAFGPHFGLPDPSPYVMKAHCLLVLSGLPFKTDTTGFKKAPKGKLPYINDNGTLIADSSLIQFHLETRHKIDFEPGLSSEQRAVAWAFEKMCDENLYWPMVQSRWLDDRNFKAGPIEFFESIPLPVRAVIVPVIRSRIRRNLKAQGTGLHSPDEVLKLVSRGIKSIADYLGDKQYMMGGAPSGVDATAYPMIAGLLCSRFTSPLRDEAEKYPRLAAYVERMQRRIFPDHVPATTQ